LALRYSRTILVTGILPIKGPSLLAIQFSGLFGRPRVSSMQQRTVHAALGGTTSDVSPGCSDPLIPAQSGSRSISWSLRGGRVSCHDLCAAQDEQGPRGSGVKWAGIRNKRCEGERGKRSGERGSGQSKGP